MKIRSTITIIIVAVIVIFIFISINSKLENTNIDETFVKSENIEDEINRKTQQELVLMYETNEFLYKTFQISFDEITNIYSKYFTNGQNLDGELVIGYYNIGMTDLPRENYEYYKGYNFTGMTIYEMLDAIRKTGYDIEWYFKVVKTVGEKGNLLYVSDPIKGYSENESYVYAKKVVTLFNGDGTYRTAYEIIKYNFEEIDGVYLISSRLEPHSFTVRNNSKLSESETRALSRIEDQLIKYGVNTFPLEVDMNENAMRELRIREEQMKNYKIEKVSISKLHDTYEINTNFIKVYYDEESLSKFSTVISHASKQDGFIDMIYPEFYMETVFDNGVKQGYYMWVAKEGGRSTLMKVENTHTVYRVLEDKTAILIDLLQSLLD